MNLMQQFVNWVGLVLSKKRERLLAADIPKVVVVDTEERVDTMRDELRELYGSVAVTDDKPAILTVEEASAAGVNMTNPHKDLMIDHTAVEHVGILKKWDRGNRNLTRNERREAQRDYDKLKPKTNEEGNRTTRQSA